jgi:TMEM199 family protein
MVLLTMTPSIVEGLKQLPQALDTNSADTEVQSQSPLNEPATGKPISHGQVIELWKALKLSEAASFRISLEELLRGSQVYVPPPPPKPEPVRIIMHIHHGKQSVVMG